MTTHITSTTRNGTGNRQRRPRIGWLRRATGLLGELLITAGVLLLLFVVWQLWWTDVTALRQQASTIQSLEHRFDAGGKGADEQAGHKPAPAASDPATDESLAIPKPKVGQAFAIIRIPRFGSDYARPVIQGTGTNELQEGVGHYLDTAMPGGLGNFAVAGHRTTYGKPFSQIDTLRKGDVVLVETKKAYYVYRVQRHTIVTPNQVDVIDPVPQHPGKKQQQHWLTMTSCHPRYYATQRWVTFSQLDRVIPRSEGLPKSLLQVPGKAS